MSMSAYQKPRFFLVAYSYAHDEGFGFGNLYFGSMTRFPSNGWLLKEGHTHASKTATGVSGVVILNIFEFKTEGDYREFDQS